MKKNKILWSIIGVLIFIIALFLVSALVKLSFTVKESYWDEESYRTTTWESYVVSAKNCIRTVNCHRCIHWNFWGTCDSCECQREVEVTRWRPVKKYRDAAIYCTLLEKLRGKCRLEEIGFAKIK